MPNYKLTYFPCKGLAEPIRFIFSYAKISFEDYRIPEGMWSEIKPITPYGQVPIIIVDRKTIAQSVAMCRYLARQCGLVGRHDWDDLLIDATVDTIHDIRARLAAFHYEKDENVKIAKRKIVDQEVPYFLECLDKQVKKNDGYFVNGTLSWADLTFVALLDYLNYMNKSDLIEKYENLKELREKVLDLPAIKTWLERRPESEY